MVGMCSVRFGSVWFGKIETKPKNSVFGKLEPKPFDFSVFGFWFLNRFSVRLSVFESVLIYKSKSNISFDLEVSSSRNRK